MSPADAFEPLRSALEQAGIRYAIGGSWASTAFGEPRFTNDVDILVEFTEQNLEWFLGNLPDTFYVDAAEALTAIRRGRPFNAFLCGADPWSARGSQPRCLLNPGDRRLLVCYAAWK